MTAIVPTGLAGVLARIQDINALIGGLSGGTGSAQSNAQAAPSPAGAAALPTFTQALAGVAAQVTNRPKSVATTAQPATTAATASGAAFRSPLPSGTLTQGFGPTSVTIEPAATVNGVYYPHYHDGLDLAAPLGTPIVAAAAGTIVSAGRVSDGAVVVQIRHDDGSLTLYGHLQPDLPVVAGQRVAAGDVIGSVGMTGNTTGPHLHFELWRNGSAIDPTPWLSAGRLPGDPAATTASAVAGSPDTGTPGAGSTGTLTAGALAKFDSVVNRFAFGKEIRDAAVSANVDPFLLASLVQAESNFDPKSLSWAGAMGLTQLMPETAKSLGVTNAYDPVQNLNGGAKYLASDLRIFGRVDLALAAYQAGKGAVRAAGGVPNYPVTRAYIARILGDWKTYLGYAS